jgi:arylsulfatase A-like enzyme
MVRANSVPFLLEHDKMLALVSRCGMVFSNNLVSLGLCLILLVSTQTEVIAGSNGFEGKPSKRPNILLLVADDLGYSDLGSFGGEISTPNLDALARNGVKLTNFMVAPSCSPTRSMLMSGTYNHKAGLGAMAEWTAENQRDKPGYEGYLNHRVVALPNLLRDAGYRTFMSGKWHLGMEADQGPDVRGFDDSFVMLPGAGNHYSDKGLFPLLSTIPYRENGKEVKLPKRFYSTEFYTDKAIEYIDKAQATDEPFFGYVAYTAPHWPLQVPEKYSDNYRGKYDVGYDEIRELRLQNLVKAGIFSPDLVANPGSGCYASWDSLSPEERMRQARTMEIYAGMIDALDENIGRLIGHLESIGELDNTLIMFMSDNGADARPEGGVGRESEFVAKKYDNRFGNLGSKSSFVSYGGAWAEVGSTPFKLHKGSPAEGGIRAPAIVSFPAIGIDKGIRREFTSVMDILPTFLEVAGSQHPGDTYQGRSVLPVTGSSMLPYLKGEANTVHEQPLYGFSVHMNQGLQYGDLKLLRMQMPYGDANWELYNVKNDPGETRNLANDSPDKLQTMIVKWREFQAQTGVIISEPGSRAPSECRPK